MNNKLWALLALLLCSATAFSQQSDSTATFQKHSIGVTARPQLDKFFSANRALPAGLIYRRQVKPDQARRFTMVGWLNTQKSPYYYGPDQNINLTTSSNYVEIMLGHEWQKELASRWLLYYGADAGVGLFNSKTEYDFSNYNSIMYASFNDFKNRGLSYSLKPFAGIRFKIHPKLFVAAETTMSLVYSRTTSSNTNYLFTDNSSQPKISNGNEFLSTNLNLRYYPISNIQVVYQF